MQLLLFIYLAISMLHVFPSSLLTPRFWPLYRSLLCGGRVSRVLSFSVMVLSVSLPLSVCLSGCLCVHCASALSLQNIWVTFVVTAQLRPGRRSRSWKRRRTGGERL